MDPSSTARFSAGAEAWAAYNRRPLGRLRHELTWHNLAPHLPAIPAAAHLPRILDAGGGTGELALRLARAGYRVWLLDDAPAMLDQARHAAGDLPPDLQACLAFCDAPVSEAPAAFDPGFFQAITCHTLIEYLPDPEAALAALAGLLCPGGLLSVTFVNRPNQVLRQVARRADPAAARDVLRDGAFCAALFGLPGRAWTAAEVSTWLAAAGLTVSGTYGVRAFADWIAPEHLDDPSTFDALLDLEKSVAHLSPYRDIARYAHLIARKPSLNAEVQSRCFRGTPRRRDS